MGCGRTEGGERVSAAGGTVEVMRSIAAAAWRTAGVGGRALVRFLLPPACCLRLYPTSTGSGARLLDKILVFLVHFGGLVVLQRPGTVGLDVDWCCGCGCGRRLTK